MINSIENRKFSKIFQNSISIASFFDRNREKYEDTSLINLFSFPIFQFKVTATSTKSTIFCQFSPLIIHPSSHPFPSNPFSCMFAPGEEILRSKKRRRELRRGLSMILELEHNLRHCQEGCSSRNPFASTLENTEFTWTTTFPIINFYCVFWSLRFFSQRKKDKRVVFVEKDKLAFR